MLAAEAERVRTAPRPIGDQRGARNDILNRAAFALGTLVGAGALTEADVRHALEAAATDNGLPLLEARKTITSGLTAGAARPRTFDRPRP